MNIDQNVINKLKVYFYEKWNPEQYGFIFLEITSGVIVRTNNLDCDGNMYFGYKSFLKVIGRLEEKLNRKK